MEASLGNEVGETHLECVVYASGKEETRCVLGFVQSAKGEVETAGKFELRKSFGGLCGPWVIRSGLDEGSYLDI